MIAANPELLERDLIKNHSVVLGFIDPLRLRGVEAASAELSARLGAQVFYAAYLRWLNAGNKADMTLISKQVMVGFCTDRARQSYSPGLALEAGSDPGIRQHQYRSLLVDSRARALLLAN